MDKNTKLEVIKEQGFDLISPYKFDNAPKEVQPKLRRELNQRRCQKQLQDRRRNDQNAQVGGDLDQPGNFLPSVPAEKKRDRTIEIVNQSEPLSTEGADAGATECFADDNRTHN